MADDTQQDRQAGAPTDEDQMDATELLLQFLHNRDASCPRCGYNLRNLTRPVCPECEESLSLRVDMLRVPLLWFVVTLTPSIFSGICGVMLFALAVIFPGEDVGVWVLDLFGLASGGAGVLLFLARDRFVRFRKPAQIGCATATWLVHLGAFAALMVLTIP